MFQRVCAKGMRRDLGDQNSFKLSLPFGVPTPLAQWPPRFPMEGIRRRAAN